MFPVHTPATKPYMTLLPEFDCVLLVVKSNDGKHRPKDFLLCDAHVIGHISEDGWLDELAARKPWSSSWPAAENTTGAIGFLAISM